MKGTKRKILGLEDNPLWYKDAIIYQLHVRTFFDSDGDGIGDFKGLTEKLDYLQDLGVTALWLLPFYPSPLKDDGYDISDYAAIHPAYGDLRDFKVFLRESHRRGLRVITELVVNHTSDQHGWFQRARRAEPGSPWRDFYVWSDTPDRYKETRIIFQDFESSNWAWDPVAKAYYWHRFYSHQPDLNYDNPRVQSAISKALDFWLDLGVDGLRLDAVPYLYEREGTNCENLPETHQFLKKLRSHVENRFKNRMFLGEANQWPEDAAEYFGLGDECHMAFHFPLMPRMFLSLRMEDSFPILDILDQTPPIPETCQWALFLRNHDELTLEMVTDEERDYMYRTYAQDPRMRINLGIRRRLAPLLGNHRRRIELMNGLLFSMPGTPVIYYGDEIGMGDNIYLGDRNGVRTPMQWSADRNAGFSKANPQKLYLPVIIDPEYHYEVINVEAEQNNTHSILWWMKRLFSLRKRFSAFGYGSIEFLNPDNSRILAFLRTHGQERLLVVANLSRFVQHVDLDLSTYAGTVPVEIFGRTPFPVIGRAPYFLSLGPHSFYWFILEPQTLAQRMEARITSGRELPTIQAANAWDTIFYGESRKLLEAALPDYLRKSRWFGGKAQEIKSVRVGDVINIPNNESRSYMILVQADYLDGDIQTYALPLTFAAGMKRDEIWRDYPQTVVARVKEESGEGLLCDAMVDEVFGRTLLSAIGRHRHIKGLEGEVIFSPTHLFKQLRGPESEELKPTLMRAEQSNSSLLYGERLFLKLIRRLNPGVNPDLEISQFLTERRFANVPYLAGAAEYRKGKEEPMTLALLQGFVPNQGDAWKYTQDVLSRFLEDILVHRGMSGEFPEPRPSLTDMAEGPISSTAREIIGPYMEMMKLLGQRTAELHLMLASEAEDRRFAPESFSKLYQRSLYQSMRTLAGTVFRLLHLHLKDLPEANRKECQEILNMEKRVIDRFRSIINLKITASRLRCHGDYHLGQVLYTGKDFVIIDFEGEPARPISERRIKRSPLRDIAGMIRSFHYAAYSALFLHEARGLPHPEEMDYLARWAEHWYSWVSAAFLKTYLETAGPGKFLPETREELGLLLNVYLLEKAVYELGYELSNRPDWVKIPIRGIQQLLREGSA
jgi:maltose alpha-D-glucosyltransferase/alpha-amylase